MIEALGRAVGTQTVAIHRDMDNILAAINRDMDNNTEKFTALQRKLEQFGDRTE